MELSKREEAVQKESKKIRNLALISLISSGLELQLNSSDNNKGDLEERDKKAPKGTLTKEEEEEIRKEVEGLNDSLFYKASVAFEKWRSKKSEFILNNYCKKEEDISMEEIDNINALYDEYSTKWDKFQKEKCKFKEG